MRKLHIWATAPIVIPRWMLTVEYGLFAALGVAVALTTQPTLEAITDDTYTAAWALGITSSAVAAGIGSLSHQLESLERWAGVALSSLLIVYALSPIVFILGGDFDRLSYSVVALIATVVPAARTFALLRTTGQHRSSEHG